MISADALKKNTTRTASKEGSENHGKNHSRKFEGIAKWRMNSNITISL